MTKLRAADGLDFHVLRAIGLLGPEQAMAATGKSLSLMHKWADPDADNHIPLAQAVALDRALIVAEHEPVIIPAAMDQIVLMRRAAAVAADPAERMLLVMAEVGDVAEAVRAAFDPHGPGGKRLTAAERKRLGGELTEAIEALRALQAVIEGGKGEAEK